MYIELTNNMCTIHTWSTGQWQDPPSRLSPTCVIHTWSTGQWQDPPPTSRQSPMLTSLSNRGGGIRGIAPLFGDLNLLYCGNKKKQGKLIPCRGSKKKCNPIAVVVWVWVCLVFFRIKCYLLYMAKTLKNKMKKWCFCIIINLTTNTHCYSFYRLLGMYTSIQS